MQINQLSTLDDVQAGDGFAVWSVNNGATRRAPASAVLAYVRDNLPDTARPTKQYASPLASPATVAVTTGADDAWLILQPSVDPLASLTITLPSAGDAQSLQVFARTAVTALAFADGTVWGAPTSIAANGYFTLRYDAILNVWMRVG